MRRAGAVLGLALLAAPLAGQAVVGIAPAATLLAQGGRATVPLVANMTNAGGAQLGAYQLQLTFDPAVVRYVGTAPGAFGAPTVNAANAGTGSLLLAGANPAGAGGVITLANLTFQMLVASGSSPATISSPKLTAAGTFAGVAVTPVSASFCTGLGTFGDVTGDGQILANDALIVVTSAVGLPIAPYTLTNADVDQDGKVDTRDALFILSFTVGLPTPTTRVGQINAGACGGPAPLTLALAPSPVQLAPGDVLTLVPSARDSAGIPTAAHGLAWSSRNSAVALVDTLGIVTALVNGTDSIIAQTVAGPADTALVTVADRHTWFVNGAVTLNPSQQLGSSAFPFATITQAAARAAAGDTIRIAVAPNPYGPATIAKPVIVLGDSGTNGMPTISNSTGAALTVNTSGRVHLQWLNLDQSNAGVDATGDTLEVQSLSLNALRGVGIRVHAMQRADLRGVRVTSATLAGIWADHTPSVAVSGAVLSVIAARNDSAAGVAVFNAAAADLSDVTVFGVDLDGPGIVTDSVTRATIINYASNTGSRLSVDHARFAGIVGAVLANGGCGGSSSSCHAAIHFRADTAVIDTVLLFNPGAGIDLQPHEGSLLPSHATITRSAIRAVQVGSGVQIDSIGDVAITGLVVDSTFNGDGVALSFGTNAVLQQLTLRHLFGGAADAVRVTKTDSVQIKQSTLSFPTRNGIEVRTAQRVRVDSTSIAFAQQGVGVFIDPTAIVTLRAVTIHAAAVGGVWVDSATVVNLAGVSVDSSAQPDATVLNAPARFAVRVAHADTVHADSLNLHDDAGGGLLVDSAQVLTGTGSLVARNSGVGGSIVECGPNGCLCGASCIIRGQAPASTAFAGTTVPGIVLSNVARGTLSHYTVDSNASGGIALVPSNISGWTFALDTSFVRGGAVLLAAVGQIDTTGQVTVRSSRFWYGSEGIDASFLGQLTVRGSTFDSVGALGTPALAAATVHQVLFDSDTIRQGPGSGIEVQGVHNGQVLNSLIHHRVPYNVNNPEAALGFNTTDTITVARSRLEFNTVRGVRVDASLTGPIAIDSSAITDDSSNVGLQVSSPTLVTNSLIARNFVGMDVFGGAEASGIHQNNFVGNTLAALRGQGITPVAADNNWWNDPLGPRCLSGCTGTVGDTVSGLVTFLPFLTGLAPTAPAFAPPTRISTLPRQQVKREGRP